MIVHIKSYFNSRSCNIPNVSIFFDIIKELSKYPVYNDSSFVYNGKLIVGEMLENAVPD